MDTENKISVVEDEGQSGLLALKDYKETAKRFVAFLDIMGFKDRVARTPHKELLDQLSDFITKVSRYIGQYDKNEIKLAQFSDSIVLFSNDDSRESLRIIANATREIMRTALSQDVPIPLKGAIALGEITCDFSKQLFFGQALIDAFLLEENTNYYGVLVHNSAEQAVIDFADPTAFKDIEAPLKGGNISHYELSWYIDPLSDFKLDDVKSALRKIRLTVSDYPRKYIDNTLNVISNNYK